MKLGYETFPVDDAHLPLAQRRHPYRPANKAEEPEAMAAACAIAEHCEGIIVKELLRCNIDRQNINYDDFKQECKLHLIFRTLPRWCRDYKTKPSTFCFVAIRNFMRDQIRGVLRRKHLMGPLTNEAYEVPAAFSFQDAAIETVADAIHHDPELILTPPQARVFQAEITRQQSGEKKRDISRGLGYARESSLSMMLSRIDDRIASIDIEDLSAELPRKVAA